MSRKVPKKVGQGDDSVLGNKNLTYPKFIYNDMALTQLHINGGNYYECSAEK